MLLHGCQMLENCWKNYRNLMKAEIIFSLEKVIMHNEKTESFVKQLGKLLAKCRK